MIEKHEIGEITFDNIIQLRDVLEEAWNRGMLDQSTRDLKKEIKNCKRLAKTLGIKDLKADEPPIVMNFQEWFLEIIKQITVK